MTTRRLLFAFGQAADPQSLRDDTISAGNSAAQENAPYAQLASVVSVDPLNGAYVEWQGGIILMRQVGDTPLSTGQRVYVSQRQDGIPFILGPA